MSEFETVTFLSDRFKDEEEFVAGSSGRWSASKTNSLAQCPAKFNYRYNLGLQKPEEAAQLYTGKAVHACLDTFYITGDGDLALEALANEFGEREQKLPGSLGSHLNIGHLEVVMRNYFDWSKKKDNFEVLASSPDDINFDRVVGAQLKIHKPTGLVVFGECKFVLDASDVVDGEFLITIIPDLPVFSGGGYYVLDHKTSSWYLSDSWARQFMLSGQLRLYTWGMQELLGQKFNGAWVNGIYVGERAALSTFKGVKFGRYPWLWQPTVLTEAITQHYQWSELNKHYEHIDFYPQNAGFMCKNCDFSPLCLNSPRLRPIQMKTDYVREGMEDGCDDNQES